MKNLSNFKKFIKAVATANGIEAYEVTRTAARQHGGSPLSDRAIAELGGFSRVMGDLFPKPQDLAHISGAKLVRKHKSKLEAEYGTALSMQQEMLAGLKEALEANPPLLHPAVPQPKKKGKVKRALTLQFSDLHLGVNIDSDEMGGLNEYNWDIAAKRIGYLVSQAAEYKRQHRDETELVVLINGDIIAGQIHNQEWAVDLLIDQFVGSLHLLGQALSYLATQFPKMRVICTSGNHGRNVGKADKGRATVHKFDSYEGMLYYSLSASAGSVHKHVEFLIPKSPYAMYEFLGHLGMVTHSDTVVHFGNPGSAIQTKSMREQINNINASEIVPAGRKLAVLCVGHSHSSNIHLTDHGTVIVLNGCLSGLDQFAQSIGIFGNNPSQTMFESTEAHAFGDARIVQVKLADKMKNLDKIIKPYLRLVDGK